MIFFRLIDLISTTYRLVNERSLFNKKKLLRASRRPERYKQQDISRLVLSSASCGFVLSTGRVGTALLTKLLNLQLDLDAFHVPEPELVYPSKMIYLRQCNNDVDLKCLEDMSISVRYELIRRSWLSGGKFVETNNPITFFAHGLASVFKQSKFIHLIRHPGDFARSGLRRGYYNNNCVNEGRLVPSPNCDVKKIWNKLHQIEKVAWLWNETNSFIEDFKSNIQQDRVLTIKSEDLFSDASVAVRIIEFLSDMPVKSVYKIRHIIKHPVNAQRGSKIDHYSNWSKEKKGMVKKWTPLAGKYGYFLDLN